MAHALLLLLLLLLVAVEVVVVTALTLSVLCLTSPPCSALLSSTYQMSV